MSRNNDLKTFFVDFPELPWYYGTLKVYTRTKRDAVQAPPRSLGKNDLQRVQAAYGRHPDLHEGSGSPYVGCTDRREQENGNPRHGYVLKRCEMRPNKGVLMRTCAGCNSFFDVARGNFYLIYPDAPDKT